MKGIRASRFSDSGRDFLRSGQFLKIAVTATLVLSAGMFLPPVASAGDVPPGKAKTAYQYVGDTVRYTGNTVTDVDAISTGEARFLTDRRAAPVKSAEDLHDYLRSAGHQGTPLDFLSDEGRSIFLNSLQFGDDGLASFNSAVLREELTADQAYALLSLFGFQSAAAEWLSPESPHIDAENQYVEGYCVGVGTCRKDEDHWCHPPSCTAADGNL